MQPALDYNPYAAPVADAGGYMPPQPGHAGVYAWRYGDGVIVPQGMPVLPPRCVRCNQPETARVGMTTQWHPAWVYVLLCLGAIPYVVVAMATRHQIRLEVPLCHEHQQRRAIGLWLILLGIFGPFAGIIAAINLDSTVPLVGSLVAFLAIIPGLVMRNVVSPKRIDPQYAWLKAGAPFVASLPDGPYPFP
jgi:hypothetical protein